jgi:hypothetical protein
MWHDYDVKILHLVEDYDIYFVCRMEQRMKTIAGYIFDPAFTSKNVHFVNVGPAATALVNYAHACYKLVDKATAVSKTREWEKAQHMALTYNMRKLLDEQARHVKQQVLARVEEEACALAMKKRDRAARRVERLESLYTEVLEMRVDYVSEDEDRELTYYEQLEVDYDEILAECEYRLQVRYRRAGFGSDNSYYLQSVISDMENVEKQPRKLKRGYNLLEWIEQEMPAYRERLAQEGSFGEPDDVKSALIEVIHGHIRAVLHPGDTVRVVMLHCVKSRVLIPYSCS